MKIGEIGHEYAGRVQDRTAVGGEARVSPDRVSDGSAEPAAGNASDGKGRGPAVDIRLSADARDLLAGIEASRGRSAQSPAHLARQALADNPGLANLPFGKVVSAIARFGNVDSLLTPPSGARHGEPVPGDDGSGIDPGSKSTPVRS